MSQISIQYTQTKIGELIIGAYDGKLCMLDYRYRKMRETVNNRIKTCLNAEFREASSDLIDVTKAQVEEYLSGERTEFDIPLVFAGTEFQKSVWLALQKIPYGQTSSYLELAKSLNNRKAIRAVASANGANALAIIVPCHRIIGSNGEMVGYAGGIPVKKRLLNLESPGAIVTQTEITFD